MEEHIQIFCNGFRVYPSNLPGGLESKVKMVYNMLDVAGRHLDHIVVGGVMSGDETPAFAAYDIWLYFGGYKGDFLPMKEAARLFSETGIPYFHCPPLP